MNFSIRISFLTLLEINSLFNKYSIVPLVSAYSMKWMRNDSRSKLHQPMVSLSKNCIACNFFQSPFDDSFIFKRLNRNYEHEVYNRMKNCAHWNYVRKMYKVHLSYVRFHLPHPIPNTQGFHIFAAIT